MTADAYIWECEEGHETAISELEMQRSRVQPRCKRTVRRRLALEDGSVLDTNTVCGADLKRRLRPFPLVEQEWVDG